MVELPPIDLPPLPDPAYGGMPGPYAVSALRDVTGTRINPDARTWYERREAMISREIAVKSCAHPDMAAWLANVESFDPGMLIKQKPLSEWPVSKVIAQIQIWGERLPYPLPEGITCMVNYEDLAKNPDTPPRHDRAMRIRERFGEDSSLLLGFFGEHRYSIGLWPQTAFWSEPFLDNFDGVVVPGFSTFSDDPIPQSLLGERMCQIFAQEGYEHGHNVIPQIAGRDGESMLRQIELCASLYPHVNTVLLDCYGSHVDPEDWAWRWLFFLRDHCAHLPLRFLVAGITSAWAIEKLSEIFPNGNYSLVTSAAMHRRSMAAAPTIDAMAQKFATAVRRFENLAALRETVASKDWPETVPTFSQARREQQPQQLPPAS